jgi:hypothetical protein
MANMPSAGSARPVWLDDKTKSIMDRAIAREQSLSGLLMTYIVTGLIFMLLPGTFLGVWNLIRISSREAAESISPAWIQAHGHAQLFGWVGTFILGIGFYSSPKLRKLKPFAVWSAWLTWALWVTGVTVRWSSNIYPWHWRIALPLSATLELVAFLIFFPAVASHRSSGSGKPLEPWIFVVIAATLGLLASLLLDVGASFQLALTAGSPAFPHLFDQRYLMVSTWACVHGIATSAEFVFGAGPGFQHPRCDAGILRTLFCGEHTCSGWSSNGCCGDSFLRARSQTSENRQWSPKFSDIHTNRVWLVAYRRRSQHLGSPCRRSTWHLGCLASRFDGWLHRHNDFLCGAANFALVLRDARAVEPEPYAGNVGPIDERMHAARRIGNPCLSGLRGMGVEHPANFCAH